MNRFLNSKVMTALMFNFIGMSIVYSQSSTEMQPGFWASIELIDKVLIFIAVLLLIPIASLGAVFKWSFRNYLKNKLSKRDSTNLVLLFLISVPFVSQAQAATSSSSFDAFNFLRLFLVIVILLEVMILSGMSYFIYKQFSYTENEGKSNFFNFNISKWWKKANNLNLTLDDEAKLDIGHNYDGIRELDNGIPVWFSAAFVITIFASIVYLWRYHVAELAPLQIDEYNQEVAQAEYEHNMYLKTAGSGIDESAIEFSDDLTDIEEGKKLFLANCASCHVADGGGATGPNLTDNYWIYGCMASDVYKSIKYGRNNGMMPWKDVYNDKQIIQIASFVKSLEGKKTAAPKPAQGNLCEAKVAATPSSSDSTAVAQAMSTENAK